MESRVKKSGIHVKKFYGKSHAAAIFLGGKEMFFGPHCACESEVWNVRCLSVGFFFLVGRKPFPPGSHTALTCNNKEEDWRRLLWLIRRPQQPISFSSSSPYLFYIIDPRSSRFYTNGAKRCTAAKKKSHFLQSCSVQFLTSFLKKTADFTALLDIAVGNRIDAEGRNQPQSQLTLLSPTHSDANLSARKRGEGRNWTAVVSSCKDRPFSFIPKRGGGKLIKHADHIRLILFPAWSLYNHTWASGWRGNTQPSC